MTNSELWQQLPPDIQAALQNPRLINDELAERSLSEFIKQAWHVLEPGQAYSHGWHIDAMAEHLEAVTNGEITRLLISGQRPPQLRTPELKIVKNKAGQIYWKYDSSLKVANRASPR